MSITSSISVSSDSDDGGVADKKKRQVIEILVLHRKKKDTLARDEKNQWSIVSKPTSERRRVRSSRRSSSDSCRNGSHKGKRRRRTGSRKSTKLRHRRRSSDSDISDGRGKKKSSNVGSKGLSSERRRHRKSTDSTTSESSSGTNGGRRRKTVPRGSSETRRRRRRSLSTSSSGTPRRKMSKENDHQVKMLEKDHRDTNGDTGKKRHPRIVWTEPSSKPGRRQGSGDCCERNAATESASSFTTDKDDEGERFTFFFTNKYPFSNHYPCRFEIGGRVFNCTEQYYMYMKAIHFGDREIAAQIMTATNPKIMKSLGRKVRGFNESEWYKDTVARGYMWEANLAKYKQNPDLRARLFETDGTTLVETNPTDKIWGIGLAMGSPLARARRTWRGQNWLGEILTKIRQRLMQCDQANDA